jgi:hypothetical protein
MLNKQLHISFKKLLSIPLAPIVREIHVNSLKGKIYFIMNLTLNIILLNKLFDSYRSRDREHV